MEKRKSILILTPDGTGIKNYLYSGVFRDANASLCLFHNFDQDTLDTIRHEVAIDQDLVIPNYSEGVKEKFLRELIHAARIIYNARSQNNPTIHAFRKKNHKSFKLKIFHAVINARLAFVSSYKTILKLESRYDRAIRKNPFYTEVSELLKTHRPDRLFCTHQRALTAPTIFAAARDLGIPTTTVIYSWDNLPKARLALRADSYLVWSDHMKKEMATFYPEIDQSQVKVTGTPQFEFYADSNNIIPRDQFYSQFQLDPNKKLICFSGDDVKTSPYDPEYLNDLAEGLTRAGLDDRYQVVFRRCPVDLSGRYDRVLNNYPELIKEAPPLWNFNSKVWTAVYPLVADIQLLVSMAYYCDVVMNVGSTMAFDFGMFQKPCIFINYDHKQDPDWSVTTIYNYQHFRSMPSEKAVYWLNDKNEIEQLVQQAIESPETEIRDWFQVVVEHQNEASQRILKELL
ncbi:MAG: hypothetical protein AAF466_08745 [Bacteroidota bacterium]